MSRLLVFTENYAPGGGTRYLVDLVNGVMPLFETVTVGSNPFGVSAGDLERALGPLRRATVPVFTSQRVRVMRRDARPVPTAVMVRAVQALDPVAFEYNVLLCRRLVREVRPGAVLSCNGGFPAARAPLAMVVAAHREGVPAALSVVSLPAARRPWLAAYERWLDRRVWAAATVIIANAEQIGGALQALRDAPPDKIVVVHNGLPDDGRRVRAEPAGRLTIGCVSRIDEQKGTTVLVDAFAGLAADYPHVDLVIAGDGPELARVEAQVARLGLQRRVTLLGRYHGDVAELVARFDIYAFPSLREGLPYALLEAMRAACPIVATRVGGIPEAVVSGVTGLLVPPGSSEAMTAALGQLIEDPGLRARLSAAARARFAADFTLDSMQQQARDAFHAGSLL